MPIEIKNEEEFLKIAEKAIECRVKRSTRKGVAKVKARTKRYLYTYKIPLDKVEEFLKRLKCSKIVEV